MAERQQPGLFAFKWLAWTSKFSPSKDLLDLKGKVAIVTGGNRGIGYWIVYHLYRRGAKVYLGARDESKGRAAIEQMKAAASTTSAGEVVFLQMDLTDPKNAQNAAQRVLESERRLDIVVNNAALAVSPYSETDAGISRHMVVNHISHFVFVRALHPLLESTAREAGSDVRVITVASTAHLEVYGPDIKYDSLESFNLKFDGESSQFQREMKIYGHSKLANILMSRELQRKYDEENLPIVCIAVNPGNVATDSVLDKGSSLGGSLLRWLLNCAFLSPEQGSFAALFSAASPKVSENRDKYKGAFVMPYDKIEGTSSLGNDITLAKTLWNTTEKILSAKYGL